MAAPRPSPARLSQLLVTRFAKYRALKNLLEKWLNEKRATIALELQSGVPCPDRGPYLLSVVPIEEQICWKQEFADYLKNQGKSDLEVFQIIAAIAARPRASSVRIDSRPNPNYRREFPIRLPK